MSIWISKRRLAALILCLPLLAACVAGGMPIRVQPVLDGAVRVAAPAGYCIEPGSAREQAGSAIVLMGRCTKGAGSAQAPAILTAAVGAQGSGLDIAANGAELAAFFTSAQGRAAQSRSGRAATVQVLEAVAAGDAFLIRLTDTSPDRDGAGAPGLGQPESWRAVLTLAGRLVTLSVTGTVQAPLDRDAGRALLDRFVAAMQAANRGNSG